VPWDAERVRGAGQAARLAAVGAVVLSALALVSLAARSGRTETLTPLTTAAPPTTPPTSPPSARPRTPPAAETEPGADTSGGEMPDFLLAVVVLLIVGLVAAAFATWTVVVRPRGGGRPAPPDPEPTGPPDDPAADRVGPGGLAAAGDAGLRELEYGGPGEGVVACWVEVERAAADAGTHRAPPETPSELAGRLIDRHDISPGPLLRLADLYREARYSRHTLPESARVEARVALERVRAELETSTARLRGASR